MQANFMITSESVTRGHPDKLCDQISDAIVGRYTHQDPYARVTAECAISTSIVFLSVKASSDAKVSVADVARSVIRDAGYRANGAGFRDTHCSIMTSVHEHPMPKSRLDEQRAKVGDEEADNLIVSEDLCTVFGFACNHTEALMPLPIWLAHKLSRRLDDVRESRESQYLAPDAKIQVGVEFRNSTPARIHGVTVVASHAEQVVLSRLRDEVMQLVIESSFQDEEIRPDPSTQIAINPDGPFIDGGPEHHAGLTGRKHADDTYGEFARHHAAALSGKDVWRVDRLASYAARYMAKNVVRAGLADECEVQLSYSLGRPRPDSVHVYTRGTGRLGDEEIAERLRTRLDLRIAPLVRRLGLTDVVVHDRDFYRRLAVHGHMGRIDLQVPWEATDLAAELR